MNGCHSQLTPNRLTHDLVYHSKGNVNWPNVFTRDCQYIKQENIVDDGCDGCREKEKVKTDSHVCEECGAATHPYAMGNISGWACSSCGWSQDD